MSSLNKQNVERRPFRIAIDISHVKRMVILDTKVQLYNTINISIVKNSIIVTLCYHIDQVQFQEWYLNSWLIC